MTSAAEVASKGRCSCSGAQFVQQIRNPASGKRKIEKRNFWEEKKKMEPVRSKFYSGDQHTLELVCE